MDSRHVVSLGVKLIVDLTAVFTNPDGTQTFSIKIYNNSSFFLIEISSELLKQIFGKNTTLEIPQFHTLMTSYFQNTKEIAHFYVRRVVKLKYGDNFTLKVLGSKKTPDPEVDKVVLNVVSNFQNQHYNFWLILPEQFSRGPSTSEVMKDVEFLRAMVRTSMKENVGLKKEMKELEIKLEGTNTRNDEQDRIFKEAMSSHEAENQKLVELINQNKKDNNDLRKTIEFTRKELEVCTVDVSILLSSISNLKDKIQFLLQILQKKRQEVKEGPPPPQPSASPTQQQQQLSTTNTTPGGPMTGGVETSTTMTTSPVTTSQPNNPEIKQNIGREAFELETPGEREIDPAMAELDFPDLDDPVISPNSVESTTVIPNTTIYNNSSMNLSTTTTTLENNYNTTPQLNTGLRGGGEAVNNVEIVGSRVEESMMMNNFGEPSSSMPGVDEEEQKRLAEEAERRNMLEIAERRRKEEEEEKKKKEEEEIRKKRELEDKRRRELDEKRKRIERERQARLLELKKKREIEREQRKIRLSKKKKDILNSIRSKPLGIDGMKQGGMGSGGTGEAGGTTSGEGRRFVPNRGESKFSRSRKNNIAVVMEKGSLLGRTGVGGYGNASLNKVVARGDHEWKLKYICPEKNPNVTTYVGIYDPTKVKFEKIPPIPVGCEDIERSYGLNVRNGKLYHLGQVVKQILPESGINNGDILHICVNLTDGILLFKLNGENVGSKVDGVKGPLSPAVSLGSQNEKISVVND